MDLRPPLHVVAAKLAAACERADLMLLKPGALWEQAVAHRRAARVEGIDLWLAAPEELIVTKLAAGREKDIEAATKLAACTSRR